MKSGGGYNRRSFLKTTFLAGMAIPLLQFCIKKTKSLVLKITGTDHVLGHRLWANDFPKVTEELNVEIFIVGSGISGLSAARYLSQNGKNNFLICEMEQYIGGNSSAGQNQFSKYPRGAHYLPLPNKEDVEVISFLKEAGMYLGDDESEKPILDDYQLVFPQNERLFFRNSWQNDLIPQKNLSIEVQEEFLRFFRVTKDFKEKKDSAGKYWFTIPVQESSSAEEVRELETYSFKKWLSNNQFSSEELLWYLDYSCRDDYGLGIDYVSAWAGIHYFAGRKHNWAVDYNDQVFTWPEGNARLTQYLSKYSLGKTLKKHLTYRLDIKRENAEVLVYDDVNKRSIKIVADKVLFATPQFVNNYILKTRKVNNFNYVPWLLTTITLKNEFGGQEELAWDNVIYGSDGLGYIDDLHQNISQNTGPKVITYYRSFSTKNCKAARKKLLRQTKEELKQLVLSDLKIAHPEIEDYILDMEFNTIGHAMISPVPGQIFGKETQKAKESLERKVFFAHSDLSGISIFEEAFHQGINAAKQMLS
ncbi:FAD-dependent oxidoreductase [Elizabethkingia anophelis]|uniref:FAD-dependent oxidoreductase n=1 Tax=Elizabethkingia anophelis TaxID=1117645 RepID=UPI0021A39C89|nr:FAD-dependent oxidoreductase [Elizabethkingia anophelis]